MYYNKIYLILATVVGINVFFKFLPAAVLAPIGVLLLLLAALAYGKKMAEDAGNFTQMAFGLIFILAIAALAGSVCFYLFSLSGWVVILLLFIIFLKIKNNWKLEIGNWKLDWELGIRNWKFYLLGYLSLTVYLFYLLATSASADSIQSPWLELPWYFLPLFFVATLILSLTLFWERVRDLSFKKPLLAPLLIHSLVFFGIAAVIYKFGYGFDQFIHEATQKYILEHGTISPKPFQYIGLYSINIFLYHITGISIGALDKFLLPVLTAVIFPIAFYGLKKIDAIKNYPPLLALFLLPFSYFIVTTPQGLANLFLLILIFLSLAGYQKWWVALAIFFIHPISGIIALIYLALLKFRSKKIIALGIFALPLAFILLAYKTNGGLHLSFNFIGAIKNYFDLLTSGGFKQNYNFPLDLVYLFQYLALPSIIAVSIWTALKFRKKITIYPLYMFGIATASFFATAIFADFSYLIGYEQKNYPERIFYISLLFLSPYLIFATDRAISFLSSLSFPRKRESSIYKIFFAALFAFFLTANLYLTYSRYDNYQNDKGKNLTSWMIQAAEKIKNDAAGKNYVVLSDQMVSAAALKLDGFKKYYKTPLGEVFYYPIPTGGPLYNEFLNLVYNNAGARAAYNAKILTGAEVAYIALPSYWENYDKIKENLKTEMRVIFEDKNIVILKY